MQVACKHNADLSFNWPLWRSAILLFSGELILSVIPFELWNAAGSALLELTNTDAAPTRMLLLGPVRIFSYSLNPQPMTRILFGLLLSASLFGGLVLLCAVVVRRLSPWTAAIFTILSLIYWRLILFGSLDQILMLQISLGAEMLHLFGVALGTCCASVAVHYFHHAGPKTPGIRVILPWLVVCVVTEILIASPHFIPRMMRLLGLFQ